MVRIGPIRGSLLRASVRALAHPMLAVVTLILLAGFSALGTLTHTRTLAPAGLYAGLWALLCASLLACTARRWKWTVGALLSATLHMGLVSVAAGFGLAAWKGELGSLRLAAGAEAAAYVPDQGAPRPLPFSLSLDGIEEEHYPTSRGYVRMTLWDEGRRLEVPADGPAAVPVEGTAYTLTILQVVDRFALEPSIPQEVRRDLGLDGPALLVELSRSGERPDRRWLLADHPAAPLHIPVFRDVAMSYVRRPDVKQALVRVSVRQPGAEPRPARAEFNTLLRHGGYQFCLLDYDSRSRAWALFRVKRDPGIPFVYAGLAAISLGAVHRLVLRPLRRARPRVVGAPAASRPQPCPEPVCPRFS